MRNAADFLPQTATQQLTRRLVVHQQVLSAAQRVLPSYLRSHCQACWFNRHGQLILQVSGPEYAAQIRFFLSAILDEVKKVASETVTQIQIKTTQPKLVAVAEKTRVSQATAQLIAHEADASSIAEIGAALGRLAGSMAKRSSERL